MSPASRIIACLFLLWGSFAPSGYAGENLRVQVILSDSNAPYQSFAQTFKQNLPAAIEVDVLQHAEDFNEKAPVADLLVTVGVKAADRVASRTPTPLLAAMVPSNTYPDLMKKRPRASLTSGLYLDQPWGRQLTFLRAALPERKKVGVLHSSGTSLNLPALRSEMGQRGLSLIARELQNNTPLFDELESILNDSEVLLAIPDNAIYNSVNIRNILLSSYRHGLPLIGLSQSYVRAGALCAIFSTPEQLAAQASAISLTFAKTHQLPDPQYPALYAIEVNQAVARTLGINIQSAELLQLEVEQTQGKLR